MHGHRVKPAPLGRASHAIAVLDTEFGKMHRAADMAPVVAEELPGTVVQRRGIMRADVQVAVDGSSAPHDKHREHRRTATEHIFPGVPVRYVVKRSKHSTRHRCARAKSP